MTADLLIRNVDAVLPGGVARVDIEIVGERIGRIVEAGNGAPAARTIDGSGLEALPGVVDIHTHFRAYKEMGVEGDEFVDLAEGAAKGGVTTFGAFVTAPPERVGVDAIAPILEQAKGRSPVDFTFHHVLWPRPENVRELHQLSEIGIRTFKLFFAYPDRGLMFDGALALDAMTRIADIGGLAFAHVEDGYTIRHLETSARSRLGRGAGIRDYMEARPQMLEAASLRMVGLWAAAAGCSTHIVHLSTGEGLDVARSLRRPRTHDISIETCPQYLAIDASVLPSLGPLGKFAPVLRPRADVEAIWSGVADGTISTIGSDHSGHMGTEKQRIAAERGIFDVPFGIPGVETILPLVYTFGVRAGRISREDLVRLLCSNPARRLGLHGRKGQLSPGADADVVLVDPKQERVVSSEDLRSKAGYSPYEGIGLVGWAKTTIARGHIVYDGSDTGARPGQFLATSPTTQRGAS